MKSSGLLCLALCALPLGCGDQADPNSLDSSSEDQVESTPSPPLRPHWVQFDNGSRRLVFTRSLSDTSAARQVDHYQICFNQDPTSCVDTKANFLDVPSELADPTAEITAITKGGLKSTVETISLATGLVVKPPSSTSADAGAESGPPAEVLSPVFGPLERLRYNSDLRANTQGPWAFWQHDLYGLHKPGSGLGGADDTWSWDVVHCVLIAGWSMDEGQEFYPVGYGTIVPWTDRDASQAPTITGREQKYVKQAGERYRPILVDHSGWYSGYLHAERVLVLDGDYVTPWVLLGLIGASGTTGGSHLHFAVYSGVNEPLGLVSKDVVFTERKVVLDATPITEPVRVYHPATTWTVSAQRPEPALPDGTPLFPTLQLNEKQFKNRVGWWVSNTNAVEITKLGALTAKIAGETVKIRVYFDGVVVEQEIQTGKYQ